MWHIWFFEILLPTFPLGANRMPTEVTQTPNATQWILIITVDNSKYCFLVTLVLLIVTFYLVLKTPHLKEEALLWHCLSHFGSDGRTLVLPHPSVTLSGQSTLRQTPPVSSSAAWGQICLRSAMTYVIRWVASVDYAASLSWSNSFSHLPVCSPWSQDFNCIRAHLLQHFVRSSGSVFLCFFTNQNIIFGDIKPFLEPELLHIQTAQGAGSPLAWAVTNFFLNPELQLNLVL